MALPLANVWNLIARDAASPTFDRVAASADRAAVATERAVVATEGAGRKMGAALGALAKAGAATGLVVGAVSLKMAGDFEFQMNRMVTAAGESRKNLKLVSDGVLNLMASTGTSAKELQSGLYMIESAGFHGAKALQVLGVAAKGAKIENAGLREVANAVTSAMVDYHVKASDSAAVMNTLIAGVAHGKTTLAELSTAFSNVGAAGAIAKVPMADLTAALATMTMHGTDAAKAGTYLRQTIGQLEAPSAKARAVMKGLGLDANQVGLTLSSGPGGLARTIQMLDDAIQHHLTPSGLVAVDMFRKAKDPTSAFQKILANLPPSMVTTFGALAQMTGGVKSLQGFLQLGGENLKTFRANTLAINEAVKHGGKNVEGWASTQKQFNTVIAQVRGQLDKWLIQLGQKLIPLVIAAIGWIRKHSAAFTAIGKVIMSVAKVAFHDLGIVIGGVTSLFQEHRKVIGQVAKVIATVFVGALVGMQRMFQTIAPWIKSHKTLVESIAVGALAAAAAIGVWTAVSKIGMVTQLAFNAVIVTTNALLNLNPIMVVVTALAALAAGLVYAYNHSKTFRDIVNGVWSDVKGFFVSAWHVIEGVLHALGTAWDATFKVMKGVWDKVLAPVLSVIGKIFYAIIGGTILLALKMLATTWAAVWFGVRAVWRDVIKPVLDAIEKAAKWLWQNAIKPILGWISDAWHVTWKGISDFWHSFGQPVFDAVASGVNTLWGGLKKTFGWIGDAWSHLWHGLGAAFDQIWGGIKSSIETGINGIIHILNFFIRGIDAVLHLLPGGMNISTIPLVHFATGGIVPMTKNAIGGVLPGYSPGVDNIPIPVHMFSGGEGILVPEATRALGGSAGIQAINAQFSSRVSSPGHYQGGGVLPVFGGFGGVNNGPLSDKMTHEANANNAIFAGPIVKAVKAGLRAAANAALTGLESPIRAGIAALPSGVLHDTVAGAFHFVDKEIRDFINGAADKAKKALSSAVGPIPSGSHLALIQQALKLSGVADDLGNESAVNTIVRFESGWNPNAINLTDSNAAAGHPSQGLMQTIPSTFNAYRLASLSANINDPLSNLVAGIRYAVATYGSLGNVPGVRGVRGGGGYVGYDSGGILKPGVTSVINASGKPEAVLTNAQWQALKDLANSNHRRGHHRVTHPRPHHPKVHIVHSVFEVGKDGALGIANYIRGHVKDSVAAMRDLSAAVNDAFKLKTIDAKIADLKTKIAGIQQYSAGVVSNLQGRFDPTQFGSVHDLVQSYGWAKDTNSLFGRQIDRLRRAGLAKGLLSQLIAAGPNETLTTLSTANHKQILATNSAYNAFNASAQGAASKATVAQFGVATTAAAQKLLTSLEKARTMEMRNIDSLVRAIYRLTGKAVHIMIDGHTVARMTDAGAFYDSFKLPAAHKLPTHHQNHPAHKLPTHPWSANGGVTHGRSAPLVHVQNVNHTVDLQLIAREAEFRESAGHFA